MNIAATYGRSLAALVCGLFTARWVLGALGDVDYGLWGLVVGLVGFVSIVNGLLGSALGRFFAIGLGAKGPGRLADLRGWFGAGVVLLGVLGTLMACVGYPIGAYAIQNWLVIPEARLTSCLWAWRWSCVGCWVSMVAAPWTAMYTAKQLIAELSAYSLLSTIANVIWSGWMVHHPGDWLATYAFVMMLVSALPSLIVFVRGSFALDECRPVMSKDLGCRVWKLVSYAALNSVQAAGWLLSNSGMSMFVNILCGPVFNGALTISSSVKTHSAQLSNAMQGAFTPVIATAYGAGDMATVRALALRVSKFAVISTALFAVPLVLELETVLGLWLKNPPSGSWELCIMALTVLVADAFAVGYRTAIYASGRLLMFVVMGESVLLLTLPVAGLMWWQGLGIWSVGCSYLLITILNVMARIVFSRSILNTSIKLWLRELVAPSVGAIAAACLAGGLVRMSGAPSLQRVILSSIASAGLLIILAWRFVLNSEERNWLKERIWKR